MYLSSKPLLSFVKSDNYQALQNEIKSNFIQVKFYINQFIFILDK